MLKAPPFPGEAVIAAAMTPAQSLGHAAPRGQFKQGKLEYLAECFDRLCVWKIVGRLERHGFLC